MKITVKWEVEDGYVGGDRPHCTKIDLLMDFDTIEEWESLPEEKKREYIADIVQEDFEQKISFGISDFGI